MTGTGLKPASAFVHGPDGVKIRAARDGTVKLWSAPTFTEAWTDR